MSKLSEIVDAATGDAVPISNLLRMVQVLAARTEMALLTDWVSSELKGYGNDDPLPDYRGPFPAQVVSDWSGPFRSSMKNLPLPPSCVPEGLRDAGAFEVAFREPVSELQILATKSERLGLAWSADVVARLNGLMDRGEIDPIVPMHGLVSAHKQVSPAAVTAVLDNVRTRVLDVALEIEKALPNAGEPGVVPSDPVSIHYAVTNHIYGSAAVAVGAGATQVVVQVVKGDRDSLRNAVRAAGLSDGEIAELDQAIDDDGDRQPGARVQAFLGRAALKLSAGAGQVITGATGSVVAELVGRYYGLL